VSSSTPATPTTAAPRRRWGRFVLVASLALNMLLIGASGAAMVRFSLAPPVASGVSTNLLEYVATLPDERRTAIWSATRNERRSLRPLRAEVREARVAWRASLAAEPFDRQRFADAQTRLLDAEMRARTEATRFFLEIAAQMTPAERAAFAKWGPATGAGPRRWWRDRAGGVEDDRNLDRPTPKATKQP
jgi:uncharacterized membrane protein